jgi:hypothetical protein
MWKMGPYEKVSAMTCFSYSNFMTLVISCRDLPDIRFRQHVTVTIGKKKKIAKKVSNVVGFPMLERYAIA